MRSYTEAGRPDPDTAAVALFAAASILLATIDHLIPKPLPFVRLGLANLPILIALELFGFKRVAQIALFKIIGQGLMTGMLFSYVFLLSASGTIASVLVMFLLHRTLSRWISFVGVSVSGALASNLAQMSLAGLLLFGDGVWVLAPPFLLVGTVTSVLLGVIANRFVRDSRWLVLVRSRIVRGDLG